MENRLDSPAIPFRGKYWLAVPAITLLLAAILLLRGFLRDVMLVLVVAVALGLAWLNPGLAWLAALIFLPILRLGGELFQLDGVTASRLLVVGFALIVFTRYRGLEFKSLLRSNGFRLFALFLLANLLSALYHASIPSVAVAFTYLEPLLFFAISYHLVSTGQLTVKRIIAALLIGGALVSVVAVYEVVTQQAVGGVLAPHSRILLRDYMNGYDSDRFGLGGRVSSFIAQPVFAGLYWVFIATFIVFYFRESVRSRWFVVAAVCVCILLLLLSGTRAGMVAFVAAAVVFILFGLRTLRQRALVVTALLGGVLLLGILVPGLSSYIAASVQLDPSTKATRNILWRVAVTGGLLEIFRDNWLLGYGPGMVQKQATAGQIPRIDGIYNLGGLENQYATILADGGIVAGIAYLAFAVGALADAVRMIRLPIRRAQGVTLLALLAAYFVFAATVTTLTEIPNLILMTIYGAFAADFESALAMPQESISVADHV